MLICATCAVEHDEPAPELCPICTDERQYVPEDGQKWLTLEGLAQEGQQAERGGRAQDGEPEGRLGRGRGDRGALRRVPQGEHLLRHAPWCWSGWASP